MSRREIKRTPINCFQRLLFKNKIHAIMFSRFWFLIGADVTRHIWWIDYWSVLKSSIFSRGLLLGGQNMQIWHLLSCKQADMATADQTCSTPKEHRSIALNGCFLKTRFTRYFEIFIPHWNVTRHTGWINYWSELKGSILSRGYVKHRVKRQNCLMVLFSIIYGMYFGLAAEYPATRSKFHVASSYAVSRK